MTELTFTKQFLSTLDARPLKLQPDHTTNPKTLDLHFPYTLPRMPNPMKHPSTTTSSSNHQLPSTTTAQPPSADPNTLPITLHSSRNPPLTLHLPSIDASTTSILELKEAVAEKLGPVDIKKIKLLWERRPCSDAKTVREVLGGSEGLRKVREGVVGSDKGVEFMVMVMGYVAPATVEKEGEKEKEGEGTVGEGKAMLEGEEFWRDLKGFLEQRLRDEGVAGEVIECFRKGWKGR